MSSLNLPPGVMPPPPNVVVFGPNANCTLDICPVEISVYGYRPSLAASITFIALYAIAIVIHAYLGIRWKQWWFMSCMLVGAVNAIIGYAGRIMMYYNPFSFAAFMIQIICVTTGPVYYCAAIYITLALAINHFSPALSRFQPKLFYYIFIPCDLFSLVLQAAGGALSTSSAGSSQVGVNLALAGLAFQVFTIVLFCAFFADYLIRYFRSSAWQRLNNKNNHSDTYTSADPDPDPTGTGNNMNDTDPAMRLTTTTRPSKATRLKLFFGFMALAILLTLARCAYRLAELHEGYTGELIRDEPLFIGLEGVMVLAAVYCLMIGHPGLVFKDSPGKGRASGGSQIGLQEYTK
ncbi:hypothetical protein N658DRAFT_101857 [Parathielavia hyrcaniae]|uniref:Sphingoid long-chain base transporter RSB1 n=1 Tax=Parathielavia hyrcaniae TaxID=113614 RepID=A0AAN6Q283_9PEZI|nr:hypothetical protein N658DRAFT_101857 [Parathielavia hyrcaniae]